MRVIDAFSGTEIKVGQTFQTPNRTLVTLLDVEPGWWRAHATVRYGSVEERWPLTVRWTHPSFLGRHVAFLST